MHDSLKCRVKHWLPRTGENHHAMRARRFAEGYTDDERLLATIELHDRPYGIWRELRRTGRRRRASAFAAAGPRIPDLDLFLRFVELDGSTEGKNPEPVEWVRERAGAAQRRGLASRAQRAVVAPARDERRRDGTRRGLRAAERHRTPALVQAVLAEGRELDQNVESLEAARGRSGV